MGGKWWSVPFGVLGAIALLRGSVSPQPKTPIVVRAEQDLVVIVADNERSNEANGHRHARHPLHAPANWTVVTTSTSTTSSTISSGYILAPITEHMDGLVTDRGNEEVALLRGQVVRVFPLV